jgi:CRP-like cAMP-binding protein
MADSDQSDLIRQCAFGEELGTEDCRVLGHATTIRELREGETLFSEGSSDDRLYIIIEGKMCVAKRMGGGDESVLHMLRDGDLAGELAFIDSAPHAVTVRALAKTRVLILERGKFESLLETNPKVLYDVMRSIIRRVHATLKRMNLQYIEMNNYITKEHGRY